MGFFRVFFEQREAVQSIKLLKPLLTWAHYINKRLYA
jgi:hypothetical protein